MENLSKGLDKEKKYLFNCSQCNKMIDLSRQVFYCKKCESNYCDDCIKGHNEIFFDHDINKTNEELAFNTEEEKNSLEANPDLDFDDKVFSDNKLPFVNETESDKNFSNLSLLFNKTMNSIEDDFNVEICRLKSRKNKENNNNDENKIIYDINLDIENLRKLPPLERLKKIMESISSK